MSQVDSATIDYDNSFVILNENSSYFVNLLSL